MFRIDDATAAASLPTPEAAGTEGYWTEGNPATGVPATLERASWFNMVQEELRAIVVAAGLTPSKITYTQVRDAIKAMYGSGRLLAVRTYTSSATHVPTAGMATSIVLGVGGGAGSGGAPAAASAQVSGSAGSSSGAYAVVLLTAAQIGASQAVTIGAAGAAGASGSSTGGAGGASTFGSLISLPGGVPSSSFGPSGASFVVSTAPNPAAAPTITTGTVIEQSRGMQGAPALGGSGGGVVGGNGGSSPLEAGFAGAGAGANGVGVSNSGAVAGVAGTAGKFIVFEFS